MPGEAQRRAEGRAIVVMGVAGSGKTTIAERIAAARGLPFIEGDDLHPAANRAKVASGVPLEDADRWPWLDAIARAIAREEAAEVVVTCSALKRAYRERLRRGAGRTVAFLFLHGSPELLAERIGARQGHFAPPALLASQLATLEDPSGEPGVAAVTVEGTVEEVVARAEAALAGLGA